MSTSRDVSPVTFAALVDRQWPVGTEGLETLHEALAAFGDVVLQPAALADVLVVPDASSIGVVAEPDGARRAWAGAVDLADRVDPDRLAAVVRDLLDPVIGCVGIGGPRRTVVRRIVAASLAGRWKLLERAGSSFTGPGWIERVLDVAGYPVAPTRSLSVVADDGPPVTFPIPAVCCVLTRRAGEGSCPTCPRWPSDQDRREQLIDWLSSVGDDDFRALTGRPRRRGAPAT